MPYKSIVFNLFKTNSVGSDLKNKKFIILMSPFIVNNEPITKECRF